MWTLTPITVASRSPTACLATQSSCNHFYVRLCVVYLCFIIKEMLYYNYRMVVISHNMNQDKIVNAAAVSETILMM